MPDEQCSVPQTKTRTQVITLFQVWGGARTPVPPPLVDPPQVSDYVNICMQWLQSWHPAVDDLTIEP